MLDPSPAVFNWTIDTTPPSISNVVATNVTATTATITWTTDEGTDTQVEYGHTHNLGITSPLNPSMVTSHSVELTDLDNNRTYYFKVISKDATGNLTVSAEFSLRTPK